VRKVVTIANELGREIATPAEARAIMGIDLKATKPRTTGTSKVGRPAPAPTT